MSKRSFRFLFSFLLPPSSFILLLCLLLLAPNLAVAKQSEILNKSGEVVVGQPVPWLSGWTMDEEVFNTRKAFQEEARGKTQGARENAPKVKRLVLVFWATWCAPCKKGMAMLKNDEAKLRNAGVQVVLVNFKQEKDVVSKFLSKTPTPFPVVLDPYGRSEKPFLGDGIGSLALPRTIVIGRDGIVKTIIGEEGDDYIKQIVE